MLTKYFRLQQSKGNESEMKELEARQEVILRHLKELKDRLMSMHKELKVCNKPTQSKPQPEQLTPRTTQKPIDVRI